MRAVVYVVMCVVCYVAGCVLRGVRCGLCDVCCVLCCVVYGDWYAARVVCCVLTVMLHDVCYVSGIALCCDVCVAYCGVRCVNMYVMCCVV